MKEDNTQRVGSLLRGFLKAYGLEDQYLQHEIYQRWEELAGKRINLKTRHIRFRNGLLTVVLSSATLRQELQMRKTPLLQQINVRLKGSPVREIEFR